MRRATLQLALEVAPLAKQLARVTGIRATSWPGAIFVESKEYPWRQASMWI